MAVIYTIFRNSVIGIFFVEQMTAYEILDGKQRLNTLIRFYENRFFNDLCRKDKYHFKNYTVSWALCEKLSLNQKLRYFLKLNTCGRGVAQEHLDKVRAMCDEVSA